MKISHHRGMVFCGVPEPLRVVTEAGNPSVIFSCGYVWSPLAAAGTAFNKGPAEQRNVHSWL